jgi:hypothetical protein
VTPADFAFYSGLDADPRSRTYYLVVKCFFGRNQIRFFVVARILEGAFGERCTISFVRSDTHADLVLSGLGAKNITSLDIV